MNAVAAVHAHIDAVTKQRAAVGGKVQEVAFKDDQLVKHGDVLARTDLST